MTKREKLVCMAYTGVIFINFGEFQMFINELLGEEIHTMVYGNEAFADMIKEKVKDEFIKIVEG